MSGRYLRVNERWLPCLAGVAAFNDGDLNMTMQWEVLPVPMTLFRALAFAPVVDRGLRWFGQVQLQIRRKGCSSTFAAFASGIKQVVSGAAGPAGGGN